MAGDNKFARASWMTIEEKIRRFYFRLSKHQECSQSWTSSLIDSLLWDLLIVRAFWRSLRFVEGGLWWVEVEEDDDDDRGFGKEELLFYYPISITFYRHHTTTRNNDDGHFSLNDLASTSSSSCLLQRPCSQNDIVAIKLWIYRFTFYCYHRRLILLSPHSPFSIPNG